MSRDHRLHLGAFMRPVGIHTAWWRYPGGWPDANFNVEHLAHVAQRLEAAKFDAFFMADHLAVMNMPEAALRRSATVTSFDPLTLLPALAVLTEWISLIATASTTYNEPYHGARPTGAAVPGRFPRGLRGIESSGSSRPAPHRIPSVALGSAEQGAA
jgi:hypothetical protein